MRKDLGLGAVHTVPTHYNLLCLVSLIFSFLLQMAQPGQPGYNYWLSVQVFGCPYLEQGKQ